jgi:hypothetical protein
MNPNKIFKTYVVDEHPNLSFAKWLETEKKIYADREKGIDFGLWLNQRYRVVKKTWLRNEWADKYKNLFHPEYNNAEGEEEKKKDLVGWFGQMFGKVEEIAGTGSDVVGALQNGEETTDTDTTDTTSQPKDSTFLGLPKGIAIGLGLVVVAGIGYGIYTQVKKGKKGKK